MVVRGHFDTPGFQACRRTWPSDALLPQADFLLLIRQLPRPLVLIEPWPWPIKSAYLSISIVYGRMADHPGVIRPSTSQGIQVTGLSDKSAGFRWNGLWNHLINRPTGVWRYFFKPACQLSTISTQGGPPVGTRARNLPSAAESDGPPSEGPRRSGLPALKVGLVAILTACLPP